MLTVVTQPLPTAGFWNGTDARPTGAVISELISVIPTEVAINETNDIAMIARLEPGQLGIATVTDWDRLTAVRAPDGAALLLIPEALAATTVTAPAADHVMQT